MWDVAAEGPRTHRALSTAFGMVQYRKCTSNVTESVGVVCRFTTNSPLILQYDTLMNVATTSAEPVLPPKHENVAILRVGEANVPLCVKDAVVVSLREVDMDMDRDVVRERLLVTLRDAEVETDEEIDHEGVTEVLDADCIVAEELTDCVLETELETECERDGAEWVLEGV